MKKIIYLFFYLFTGCIFLSPIDPALVFNEVTCNCECSLCNEINPITLECIDSTSFEFDTDICIVTTASIQDAIEACDERCQPEGSPIECNVSLTNSVSIDVETCDESQVVRSLRREGLFSSTTSINQSLSSVVVSGNGKTGSTPITGEVSFEKNCTDTECELILTSVDLQVVPFTMDNHSVSRGTLANTAFLSAVEQAPGAFLVNQSEAFFNAVAIVDNTRYSAILSTSSPIMVQIDENTNQVIVTGVFFSEDNSIEMDVFIIADIINLSPSANSTEDQIVECGELTHLSGAASTDPENDIQLYSWVNTDELNVTTPIAIGSDVDVELPLGTNEISLVVLDGQDAIDIDTTTVEAIDSQGPEIEVVEVTPDCLWPPNHKLVLFELNKDIVLNTRDQCSSVSSIKIVDVTSSEPANTIGDGNTEPDIFFGPNAVCLRSERAGNNSGRIYTITIEAEDTLGNKSQQTIPIVVNHSSQCERIPQERYVEEGDAHCTL